MQILMVVNTVSSTFSELFGSSGDGRAIANNIGQHLVQSIRDNETPGQNQGFLLLQAPTIINIIYDAAEQGTYTGTIAVDIDATGHASMPGFGNEYWQPFIYAVEAYFKGFVAEVSAFTVTSIYQPGTDIDQVPLRVRTDLDQQVCAKPVDLRPAIQAQIPNWNFQQPHSTHC